MDNTSIKENFKKIYDVVLLADSDKDTFTFDGIYSLGNIAPTIVYNRTSKVHISSQHVANVEQHENHYTMQVVDKASFIELGQKFLYGLD